MNTLTSLRDILQAVFIMALLSYVIAQWIKYLTTPTRGEATVALAATAVLVLVTVIVLVP